MKTDLSKIDQSQFYVNGGTFCGVPALLVTPKQMGVDWTRENEIFRSSIWDLEGNLLSASFKKFVNWEEKPDFHPAPKSLRDAELMDKLDGSTLIVDYVNGQLSMRTRGTFSYETLDNAIDFMEAAEKYPQLADYFLKNENVTLLFEIVTPNNRIVINYGDEVEIYLIGAVSKDNYYYATQTRLDEIAAEYGFKRPVRYSFDSIEDMCAAVSAFEGKEGVCVYYNGGQSIRKVKAAAYLLKHRMKSELSSAEKVLDLFLYKDRPDFNSFYAFVAETFDFELAEQVRGTISNICDADKEARRIVAHMESFVVERLGGLTRAQQARIVLDSYGNSGRSGMVFKMLDKKELGRDEFKKLILQILKK